MVLVLVVISYWGIYLFNSCCDQLNTLIASVGGVSSTVLTHLEVRLIFRRNLGRIAIAVLPIIFSVCCSFYVAYGRTSSRLVNKLQFSRACFVIVIIYALV